MARTRLTGTHMTGRVDYHAARELLLFIENDADLYRQQYLPIDANLKRKLKRGVFDKALAVKLFMYLADNGAKKYMREYGTHEDAPKVFNRKTRLFVAAQLFRYWMDERRTEGVIINPPKKSRTKALALWAIKWAKKNMKGDLEAAVRALRKAGEKAAADQIVKWANEAYRKTMKNPLRLTVKSPLRIVGKRIRVVGPQRGARLAMVYGNPRRPACRRCDHRFADHFVIKHLKGGFAKFIPSKCQARVSRYSDSQVCRCPAYL